MEVDERKDQELSSNDVVVVISNTEEGAKMSEKSEDSKELDKFQSGSYSFSKYLHINPPISQLSETNKVIPSTSSTSATEKMQQIPSLDEKSTDSLTPRRRSIRQSAYSKPKSRLVEPSYPITKKVVEEKTQKSPTPTNAISPNKTPPNSKSTTPRTPVVISLAEEDDEDEDDDLYKTDFVQVIDDKKKGKKLKMMSLIELSAFICILSVLACSLMINILRKSRIWSLEIWKWSVLVLVIFCGRLVTEWCTNILVFLFERNYIMKKKVLYFVYSLKKSVRILIWLSLILLVWSLLINREVHHPRSRRTKRILNYITRALASSLIGSAMWTLKTLVVKLLASSFHVKRFFDRIQASLFHQYVLQTLSGPPLMEFSAKSSGRLSFKSKGKQVEKQEVVDVEKLHKIKREKVSAWTMGGLVHLITTSGLSAIVDSLEESVDDEVNEQKEKEITNEVEAKAAAYKIFKNVAKPRSKHIDEEDLLRFMNMEEIDNVLPFFEGAVQTGKIKKLSFYNWVVKVYNERKYLAHSLNDTKTAIEELNKIVSGIVLVVILIVWLLLMELANTRVLVFISSQMLLVVFMFGNTVKTVFEGLIFVFIMHPFDVGDRCVVDGIQPRSGYPRRRVTVTVRSDDPEEKKENRKVGCPRGPDLPNKEGAGAIP